MFYVEVPVASVHFGLLERHVVQLVEPAVAEVEHVDGEIPVGDWKRVPVLLAVKFDHIELGHVRPYDAVEHMVLERRDGVQRPVYLAGALVGKRRRINGQRSNVIEMRMRY